MPSDTSSPRSKRAFVAVPLSQRYQPFVVRARRTALKGDDSVVKLRPVVPEEVPPRGTETVLLVEDEDAVRSLGKNVYAYKMQSLIIGGLFGALAGFMTALRSASIGPSFFATDVTFFAYTVLLIGGAARVFGPVVGSIIFWFLISALGIFFSQATGGADPLIPNSIMSPTQASLMRFIFLGLGLMLLMIYRPQGIFGDRRELAIDAR